MPILPKNWVSNFPCAWPQPQSKGHGGESTEDGKKAHIGTLKQKIKANSSAKQKLECIAQSQENIKDTYPKYWILSSMSASRLKTLAVPGQYAKKEVENEFNRSIIDNYL